MSFRLKLRHRNKVERLWTNFHSHGHALSFVSMKIPEALVKDFKKISFALVTIDLPAYFFVSHLTSSFSIFAKGRRPCIVQTPASSQQSWFIESPAYSKKLTRSLSYNGEWTYSLSPKLLRWHIRRKHANSSRRRIVV